MSSSLLEALGDAEHGVGDEAARQAVELAELGSSRARFASSCPSFELEGDAGRKRLPQLALRPLHLDGAVATLTVTPFGSAMGFFPIRDIVARRQSAQLQAVSLTSAAELAEPLPDVAEHFAADAGLHGLASGHHAARRRQDARAEPAEHLRHIVAPEVDAAAGAADALDAGDQLLAVRAVLQEQAQRLDRRGRFGRRRRRRSLKPWM